MFARVLYVDEEKALELNWLGLGALQVRFKNGAIRRAHPVQKMVILSIATHFENAGQPLHPSNPRCMVMLKDMCELICESPRSLAWQAMMQADLRDVGQSYANG